jgi:hypothetical protein
MDAAPTEAVESKSYDMLGDLQKRVSQLAADRAEPSRPRPLLVGTLFPRGLLAIAFD